MDATRRLTGKGLAGFIQKPYTASRLAEQIKIVLTPRALLGERDWPAVREWCFWKVPDSTQYR